MSKELQLVVNNDLGPVPDILKKRDVDISAFTSGLQPSFPTVNVKGKTWGIRFGGETTQFTEADARAGGAQTPVPFLDVIIVASQTGISKSYYEAKEFDPNSKEPPTCWSADGVRPDDSVEQKQNPTCGNCPKNIRGSKTVEGKKLKACMDIKRLAVVRQAEIDNPLGPILLRVTPGSQSNYRTYMQWLAGRHRTPFSVVTRMTFDSQEAFPKIKFRAERGVDAEEAVLVDAVLDHPMLNSIVNGKDVMAFADTQQEEEDAAGGLPPTGGLPPATSKWSQPAPEVTQPSRVEAKPEPEPEPALTAAQQQIKALQDQLAAAQKANEPEPEPEPEPVLTPEQLQIKELQAQLAAAKAPKKPGRPRSTPVGPPAQTGNGTVTAEKPAAELDNQIAARVAKAAGKVQP